jgi:hypothetical protein
LAAVPAATPRAPASSATRRRSVCQGTTGTAKRELLGQRRDDRGRVERPDRPAELHGEHAVARAHQAVGRLVERGRPAGGAQAELRRHALLQQRAADHRRARVLLGQRGAGVGGGAEVVEQRPERAARDEHQRGVDDVLRGRAVVDVGGGPRADRLAQRLH